MESIISIFFVKSVQEIMHYNNIRPSSEKKAQKRMFYFTTSTTLDPTNNPVYYFVTNGYGFSLPTCEYLPSSPNPYLNQNYLRCFNDHNQPLSAQQAKSQLISIKIEVSETIEGSSQSGAIQKVPVEVVRPTYKKCQNLGIQEIKLDFRTEWKNQNRNIVPNLVNQMMSFLLKKNKSHKLINKLFDLYPHSASCTIGKFYLYMKKIKDSISHYVNESVIQYFFQVHEPKCEIYSMEEQQFYMKLCRIAIVTFLKNDAIIISLTSTRMSEAKRMTHLIAREALLKKFLQLANNRLY